MVTKPAVKTEKAPKKSKAPAAPKKTVVHKKMEANLEEPKVAIVHEPKAVHKEKEAVKPAEEKGRYIFATGRRKTAIANVRMFEGAGEMVVNKKPIGQFFGYSFHLDEILKPFEVTGLSGKHYFTAHINGGGPHAQATALRHGIAIALGKLSEEVRVVLKKNGFLTRDDRKKERKKPGLKRARRSPQWAKR